MDCIRCGKEGAERKEAEFETGAVVVMYLSPDCSEKVTQDREVIGLSPSSGQ